MRFCFLIVILVSISYSGIAAKASAVLLGAYSFTDYRVGRDTAFEVEKRHSGLTFSPLQTNIRSTGVVSRLNSKEPFLEEPYTSYFFDGRGYSVAFPELRVGEDPVPSGSFFEFSINPSKGKELNVDSIAIDIGSDFTTTYRPNILFSVWYSVDGRQFLRIGEPFVHSTNSRVYKIERVLKDFHQQPEALYSGTGRIVFRFAFSVDDVSGSREKHLFIDNISVYGDVIEKKI